MLCLGSKYQVDHVRDEAIHRLRRCFPSKLSAFPARNVYLQDPGFALMESIFLRKKDAIGVVNLARAFDLNFLLPPAFYLCAQLDYDELVDGVGLDTGGGELANVDGNAKLSMPEDVEGLEGIGGGDWLKEAGAKGLLEPNPVACGWRG